MAQAYYNGSYSRSRTIRARKGAGRRLALIVLMGGAAFAGGFVALWTLGSLIVGGNGLGRGGGDAEAAAIVGVAPVDYTVEPLVDMLAFRDLSYVPVKGIHLTPNAASSDETLDPRIGLADRTELNAFVIDVKSDSGWVAYDSQVPMALDLGTVDPIIEDLDGLLAKLAEHDIIPIARIVCFKDDVMTKKRPDLAIQKKEGEGVWAGKKGDQWLNPYNHEVWDYLVQVAEDCARRGFREIQFDYVRFPTDGDTGNAEYPGKYCSKDDAVAGFLAYARPRLEKLGVWVSADVYGLVVTHQNNAFGQQLEKICRSVDVVSPMVYPSHYDSGSFGVDNPNAEPYKIVSGAMQDAAERLVGTGAECRPWLQDFEWAGVKYGPDLIAAQIRAAEEQGFDEWLLWGPYRSSTEAGLDPQ